MTKSVLTPDNPEFYSDWHIDISNPVEDTILFPGQVKVPDSLKPFLIKIINEVQLNARRGIDRFTVTVDSLRYRAQLMRTDRYALRRIRTVIPSFDDLNIRSGYRNLLLDPMLRTNGGLVLISGAPGSGKSSTVAATVKERLSKFGGFCLTVEDPPEFNLTGYHGNQKGYCDQLDASSTGYKDVLHTTLRCFPAQGSSMLMFGEVRDAESATELLRIALDGHLVISTIHAKDIISAVQRMVTLGGSRSEEEARVLLAGSLKLIIHQRLDNGFLTMQALSAVKNDVVGNLIYNGSIANLGDEIRKTQSLVSSFSTEKAY